MREGGGRGLNDCLSPPAPWAPTPQGLAPGSPPTNLCWQDSHSQDGARAYPPPPGGCFPPGTWQSAGPPSAAVPRVASRQKGARRVPGNGPARPLAAVAENAPPRPQELRLSLPESLYMYPLRATSGPGICTSAPRFRGEQGRPGSGLVRKTDNKRTKNAAVTLGVTRATFPSEEMT